MVPSRCFRLLVAERSCSAQPDSILDTRKCPRLLRRKLRWKGFLPRVSSALHRPPAVADWGVMKDDSPDFGLLPLSCLQINTVVQKFRSEFSYCAHYDPTTHLFYVFASIFTGRQAGQAGLAYFAVSIGKTRRFSRFQRGLPQAGSTGTAKLCGELSPPLTVTNRG
jgi:hypothetical protein